MYKMRRIHGVYWNILSEKSFNCTSPLWCFCLDNVRLGICGYQLNRLNISDVCFYKPFLHLLFYVYYICIIYSYTHVHILNVRVTTIYVTEVYYLVILFYNYPTVAIVV